MKNYLEEIYNQYPTRKDEIEKERFRNYVIEEVSKSNYDVEIETIKKHNNVLIGDIQNAKIIFTAHYDTPATSFIPNYMFPRNKGLWMISHFTFPISLGVLSYIFGYLITKQIEPLSLRIFLCIFIYLSLFFSSFYLSMFTFKNKHNKNDNTSGVSTILSLIEKNDSKDIAFVLFDNEEKGLLGSKAFNEKHKEILKDKFIINFDCVGIGENVLIVVKDKAFKHDYYEYLKQSCVSNEYYHVLYFSNEEARSNSDFRNFECAIGVMTCECKNNIYYVDKIHTNKDKEANINNIDFLVESFTKLIKNISQ